MNQAATTWALAIGIDAYENFDDLTGAARDTAAAVRWLQRLGVPSEQILLHAAPCSDAVADIDALGVPHLGCTEPEIWASFKQLKRHKGTRLFVFLCGHGLYEPGGELVFITQEADGEDLRNLGIRWYSKYLRGLRYDRQFIFMDGCLNLPYSPSRRARFSGGSPSGAEPPVPRPDVIQIFCSSASVGERAAESRGRGVFTETLLEALDLDSPESRCVEIDDSDGALVLDLERAIKDYIAPVVVSRTASTTGQHPSMRRLDDGPALATTPIARLAPGRVAEVRISVAPLALADRVARLSVTCEPYAWRRDLPAPPAVAVPMPHDCVLPVDLAFTVRCVTMPGVPAARSPSIEFTPTGNREIALDLSEKDAPLPGVSIETVDFDGATVGGMTLKAYTEAEALADGDAPGLTLQRHESGPMLYASRWPDTRLHGIARRMSRVIATNTPESVHTVIDLGGEELGTWVEFPMSAAKATDLAGPLLATRFIAVGDERTSLAQAQPLRVDSPPGPTTVLIDLPWGRWSRRIVVEPHGRTLVELPSRVGEPPLRVRMLRAANGENTRRSVVASARAAVTVQRVDVHGQAARGPRRELSSGDSVWSGRIWTWRGDHTPRWTAYAAVERRQATYLLPLNEHGAIGLRLGPRLGAEPLSLSRSPLWDRLVTSGQLQPPDSDDDAAKPVLAEHDALLVLAHAYACFAYGCERQLSVALAALRRLDRELPDIDVLQTAAAIWRNERPSTSRRRMDKLAASLRVPVFRWGVGIGVATAREVAAEGAEAYLAAIEARLVATSTWTMWRS